MAIKSPQRSVEWFLALTDDEGEAQAAYNAQPMPRAQVKRVADIH